MSGLKRFQLFGIDWLILNFSFVLMHYAGGRPPFTFSYVQLWLVVNTMWLLVGFTEKKTIRMAALNLLGRIGFSGRNALFALYLVVILLVLLGITGFTRYHVIGTFAVYWLLITLVLCLDQVIGGRKPIPLPEELRKRPLSRHAGRIMLLDLVLLVCAFTAVHYYKYHTVVPADKALEVLLILSAVWIVTAAFTEKFHQAEERNIFYALSPFIKAFFISMALMSVIVFALRLFKYSRTLIFGTLLLLLIMELVAALWRMVQRSRGDQDADIETVTQVQTFIRQHKLAVEDEDVPVVVSADVVLQRQALADWPQVYEYLKEKIDLATIDISLMRVLYTQTLYNIEMLAPQSLRLFINLHLVNDFQRINEYFLQVHSKLKSGGYFLLRKERLENYRERLEAKFPSYIAMMMYVSHFLWHRVCPKLPVVQRFYFFFSGGKSRVMTRAEIIGRLHFCGFQLVHFEHIGDSHWFLVQKTTAPSLEANPSNGPLIKLRRIGYQGRIFKLYKFRTMHPYAEFLQEYVHETNELDETGKFKDDFRLTQWGKVMRKYWLDELPQLINYLRGDIRFIGARAISEHYFSLYPKDVQQLRIQNKPGLIPPYYADMPKTFEEIVESERRYLTAKQQAPVKTDIVYFWRALVNILFKKAHSK
jgi:lipopolysaccharide/colanic/teichoic acid biosynthesis glycosyltransferase